MSTFAAFFVWFLAGLGAPVQHCDGVVSWGADAACIDRSGPPPEGPIWVEHTRQISNGL